MQTRHFRVIRTLLTAFLSRCNGRILRPWFATATAFLLLCASAPDASAQLKQKLSAKLDTAANHAARAAVAGAVKGIRDARLEQSLIATLDSILLRAHQSAAAGITTMRDSLLSDYTVGRLQLVRDSVVGAGLRRNIEGITDAAVGERMMEKTRALVRSGIDEALSTTTQIQVAGLLDTLGKTGTRHIVAMADSLLTRLNSEVGVLSGKYNAGMADLETKVRRFTLYTILLLGMVLLACGGLAYVYRTKVRMEKLTSLLTYQIHETKDEAAFDDLKYRISNHAKRDGLEPMLRGLLKSKGILGDASRQSVNAVNR